MGRGLSHSRCHLHDCDGCVVVAKDLTKAQSSRLAVFGGLGMSFNRRRAFRDWSSTNKNPGSDAGVRSLHVWIYCYLSAVETVLNVVFKFVPSACTVAMIATAMPAAMRPYSMAVAPDSSRMNCEIDVLIDCSCTLLPRRGSFCRPHAIVEKIHFARVNLTAEFS